MCSSSDSVIVSSIAKVVKNGYGMWYKKRLFGKNWREVQISLHQDSTLMWYDGSNPEGGILLKDIPEMIAVGQFTASIPNRPEFPEGYDIRGALAIGNRVKPMVQWFAFKSEMVMVEWMKAIVSTLPPPPQPPQQSEPMKPEPSAPEASPHRYPPPPPPPPPYSDHRLQPQPVPQVQGYQRNPGYGPGGFGGGYGGGGNQTIILQDRRDSGPGFGTGLLLGSALGFGLGGGYHGWGMGIGWGYSPGIPSIYGGGGYNDVDVHNTYNYYNSTTNVDQTFNNTNNIDNSTDIEQTNNITNNPDPQDYNDYQDGSNNDYQDDGDNYDAGGDFDDGGGYDNYDGGDDYGFGDGNLDYGGGFDF